MIEKQMKKLLTKNDLQKVYKIESYPLYYIDNNSPKKITYVPNHNVNNVEKKEWGTWHTISYERCLDELNTLWHVGGTVILQYNNKLKGYKTTPFKNISIKRMI